MPRKKDMKNGETDEVLELKERMKELDCLYKVADIISDPVLSLDSIFQQITDVLPDAFQFPDITCARMRYMAKDFRTKKFISTPWYLISEIKVKEKIIGSIEVFYIREKPKKDHGPFLKEEKKLLDSITQRLGRFLERTQADIELKRYREMLNEISARSATSKDGSGSIEEEWRIILNVLLKTDPSTLFMITRKMIYYLSHYKEVSFEGIMIGLCPIDSRDSAWCGINIPNPKSDIAALERVEESVFDLAKQTLQSGEILELITLWLRQSKTRPLLFSSEKPNISKSEISDILNQYLSVPINERFLSFEDGMTIRTNLIRRFLTSRLEYLNVAKKYFRVQDFAELMGSIIGPSQGVGTLGGKASGLILAERIIRKGMETNGNIKNIGFARSWYVSSDTMRDFINYNTLEEVAHIKYLEPAEIRNEQPFLEQMFKNGVFPQEIVNGLKDVIREANENPLIIRSSSHLEDSFGAAFSGKYKSLFITNKGTLEEKLRALEDAIAEVWASTFNPNAIQYRKERGMLDLLEYMGVIIQEVVGMRIGPFYLPAYAGVALSNNEFRWSPRIRREDGILRLVVGLGTRAVDRISNDYPTLISPKRPQLRANTLVDEAVQYSQRFMDVINLEENRLETVPVDRIMNEYGEKYPLVRSIFSIFKDGSLMSPATSLIENSEDLIVTFNGFDENHPHLRSLNSIMELLKIELGYPVDIEFASDGTDLIILQCRPQAESGKLETTPLPHDIPSEMILFTASRYVTSSVLKNLEFVVYVDAEGYENLSSREDMLNVARLVGELNEELPRRKFILVGPGRWGSRGDIKLGVPVQYQDINNTCLLVEVARRKGGYLPELSFGTHFFQDLVEANIMYLPLYPDEGGSVLNRDLIMGQENYLESQVESTRGLSEVVRLVHIPDISKGGTLSVYMDGDKNEAVAYITPPDHSKWRYDRIIQVLSSLDSGRFGIVDIYLTGSVKECCAGPASDIDLIIHFRGTPEQKEDLIAWFNEWSKKLDQENLERTGITTGGLLDIHLITDQDILDRSSWAVHLDALYGNAEKLDLTRYPDKKN